MSNTFKSKKSKNVGTSLTSVGAYTPAANTTAIVVGLTLCNTSNSSISVSASQYDGTNDYYILANSTLLTGGSVTIAGGDQKLVLVPGENIRAVSNSAASLDVIMTILEIV